VETGGSLAFVVEGRTFVGSPGAPGCTTTGFAGCCAEARIGERPASTLAAASAQAHIALTITLIISDIGPGILVVCDVTDLYMTAFIKQAPYFEMPGHYMRIPKQVESRHEAFIDYSLLNLIDYAELKPCFVIGIARTKRQSPSISPLVVQAAL
jgi:hypothetical protein